MKQPDTSALRERLASFTSEQDIQELDGLTEKINGQINGLHNLLDEIKDLREEMHGIHESLRHTLQRERTAFNALTAAKDSAENIVDGISNAIVKAEQHTVIKAEVSTAELEKINQWSAAHIKAEEEIWTRQSKKLARYLSKNEGIWLSSRWLICNSQDLFRHFLYYRTKKVSDAICEDTQLFSLSQPGEPITCSSGCIFPASCN